MTDLEHTKAVLARKITEQPVYQADCILRQRLARRLATWSKWDLENLLMLINLRVDRAVEDASKN